MLVRKRQSGTGTIAGAVLAALLCSPVPAQTANPDAADAKLEFDVASIKSSALPGTGVIRLGRQGGPGSRDPGRVTYTFSTIRDLIVDAYGVNRSQVSGGPSWVDSERFDIVAKVPAGATKEQVKVMLQNLLAKRFHLTLHRETKELPIYALLVGAKGPKLKNSKVGDAPPASDAPPPRLGVGGMKIGPDGCPETPPVAAGRAGNFLMMTPHGECMLSTGQTMQGLAQQLSDRFDRPVIDQTGLTGTYDLRLRYDPSSMPGGRGGPIGKDTRDEPGSVPAGGDPANRAAPNGDPPGIFTALQEQLGLKLESRKGPVGLLMIDRVDKMPTEN
jgi:uncharacterized protein (TIGR03435 family)